MLKFEGKPKFLGKYAVNCFSAFQAFGEMGILNINLHSRKSTSQPYFEAFSHVQGFLGEKVECKIDDWRFDGRVGTVTYDSLSHEVQLTVFDALADLNGEIGSNVFANETIKDIVSGVTPSDVDVEYLGGAGGTKVKLAIQYQESALRFVKRLLAEHGFQIWCDGKKVYIGSETSSGSSSLKLGSDIVEFQIHTELGAEKVELSSIAYTKKTVQSTTMELKGGKFGNLQKDAIDIRKKTGKAKKTFHIIHEDSSYDDTTHFANRFLRSGAKGRFAIEGRVMAPVDLGSKVKIKSPGTGAGEESAIVSTVRCSGKYGSEEIVWSFEAVNPESIRSDGIETQGSLIASTAYVEETYDEMNRVKVRFPWDGKQKVTPWIRVAAPSWGEQHVHFIPPRIGDTVLVVWGQVDMDPIVIGCVTGGDKVGEPKSDMVIQTVDGQTISIGESKITMKNDMATVSMEKQLVEIDVAGSKIIIDKSDIEFSANGSITLKAPAGINLKTMKLDVG